jgi:hypothetical protein
MFRSRIIIKEIQFFFGVINLLFQNKKLNIKLAITNFKSTVLPFKLPFSIFRMPTLEPPISGIHEVVHFIKIDIQIKML